ncbi:DUF5362 family protein [Flavitalea flava]
MEQNTEISLFELQVDNSISGYLKETAKWGKFLSILGFIFCGLFVIIALFAGTFIASTVGRMGGAYGMMGGMGALISVIYILIALLYFFPCLYLYNFSKKTQAALLGNDQNQLIQAFRNLKSLFRFWGILTVIILGFYALVFIIAIIAGAFTHSTI